MCGFSNEIAAKMFRWIWQVSHSLYPLLSALAKPILGATAPAQNLVLLPPFSFISLFLCIFLLLYIPRALFLFLYPSFLSACASCIVYLYLKFLLALINSSIFQKVFSSGVWRVTGNRYSKAIWTKLSDHMR